MSTKRSTFSGKLGFVLAAAGSAVGLGNIWRFPYLAAKYGGGIFLLVYLILAITFGFALIGAFRKLDKRFTFIGDRGSIVPMIILPYYCVIGGWVIKYLCGFISGSGSGMAADSYFGDYIGNAGQPLVYFFIFIALTAVVVLLGVQKGIEKVSKFMIRA